MEYITVRETAVKWGIAARQVQNLCDKGRIPGAIRFNRCWAVPANALKPADGRSNTLAGGSGMHLPGDRAADRDCSLFQFAMYFPYPMQIMTPDGTVVLFNDALKKLFHISDAAADKLVGRYNMLKYPMMETWGLKEDIERLFRGEQVQWKDKRVPLQEISDLFGEGELTTDTLYQDIFGFTIYDDSYRAMYVVIIYILSRIYSGKDEITKGLEYLENNWLMKFDLEAAAKASGLSRSHFEKLFKMHTGFTPHQYYLNIKTRMLQKKLINHNLSIARAFEECGMEYNSYYVGVFKQWAGMTPLEYRRAAGGGDTQKNSL